MISFKEFINESSHAELEKRYAHMRKSELDGSGLESRGEKMRYSRAANAYGKLLHQLHPDEAEQRKVHHAISVKYDETHKYKELQ